MSRTAVPAGPVIERILEGLRQEAASKRLDLSSEIDDLVVYADAVRMEQIVWNLLSNAVKFTPSDGRIVVRLARDGASAGLEVSDTGIGIERETIDHVFDMFRQARAR